MDLTGWTKRTTIDEPRLSELVELYEELGFEVLRVRDLGSSARVEVGEAERERARVLGPQLAERLLKWGFLEHELAVYGRPYREEEKADV